MTATGRTEALRRVRRALVAVEDGQCDAARAALLDALEWLPRARASSLSCAETERLARTLACPTCDAEPHQPCTEGDRRTPVSYAHASRWAVAARP